MPINVPVDDKDCWQKALNAQRKIERTEKLAFRFVFRPKVGRAGDGHKMDWSVDNKSEGIWRN